MSEFELAALTEIGRAADAVVALCKKLEEDVRRCDHGYIYVSCGQCCATWIKS